MDSLLQCFLIAYHNKYHKCKILNDSISYSLLTNDEYRYFKNKINYKMINLLSVNLLVFIKYCETQLNNSIKFGCKQYLIFNSGYNTYFYRNKIINLKIFEIDNLKLIQDKILRLNNMNISTTNTSYIISEINNFNSILLKSNYDKNKISFCNLFNVTNKLNKNEFEQFIINLSSILCNNSTIIFDYDNKMYNYNDIQLILEKNNFLIYEHLNYKQINDSYLNIYNMFNPNDRMYVNNNYNLCMAIKKI